MDSYEFKEVDLQNPSVQFGNKKSLNNISERLQSTLKLVRKTWNSEYSAYLKEKEWSRNKGSPANKALLHIREGDVVLVVGADNSLTLGRVLLLLRSGDGE